MYSVLYQICRGGLELTEKFDDLTAAVYFVETCKKEYGDDCQFHLFHFIKSVKTEVEIDGKKYFAISDPVVEIFIKEK